MIKNNSVSTEAWLKIEADGLVKSVTILGRDIKNPQEADYIVKAVNNHANLVEALEEVLRYEKGYTDTSKKDYPDRNYIITRIEATLAAVKEELDAQESTTKPVDAHNQEKMNDKEKE